MASENVQLIQRLYEWMASGEAERSFEVYDPEIEWDSTRAPWLLELGFEPLYRGHDAIRTALRDWVAAWEFIHYEPEELIDGGDRVLAFVRIRARGRASGVDVSYDHPQLWTIRDGKVIRCDVFADRAEALRALEQP